MDDQARQYQRALMQQQYAAAQVAELQLAEEKKAKADKIKKKKKKLKDETDTYIARGFKWIASVAPIPGARAIPVVVNAYRTYNNKITVKEVVEQIAVLFALSVILLIILATLIWFIISLAELAAAASNPALYFLYKLVN